MNSERRREIRQAAALRCASELNASATEDGYDSKTFEDWPDPEEREAFSDEVTRIIQRLYQAGRRARR